MGIILAIIGFILLWISIIIAIKTDFNPNKVESKDDKKLKFEEIEKEIAKQYKIVDFPDSEFKIFNKEAEVISYNNYIENEEYSGYSVKVLENEQSNITQEEYEEADDLPGREEDYVEDYKEFNEKDLDIIPINIRFATEFERKKQKIYMMSYYTNEDEINISNYVFVTKMPENLRFHISTESQIEKIKSFDDIYFDNEDIIKNRTYEKNNKYFKLSMEDKNFFVELYNKYKFDNSIIMKDSKLYVKIAVTQKEFNSVNISKFYMEIFERFIK